MKSFEEFAVDSIETIETDLFREIMNIFDSMVNEDSTSSSTTTAGVQNPDAKPIGISSFMGHKCIEVDDETYSNCIQGKQPFKRWSHYTNNTDISSELKKMYNRNKKLLIKNKRTGSMVYIK